MKHLKNREDFINENTVEKFQKNENFTQIFESILNDVDGFLKESYTETFTIDRVKESKFFVHILNEDNKIVACIEYHFDEKNPFYDNGAYPENQYVIEVNNAVEVNGILDYDNIQLVPTTIDGEYDLDELHACINEAIDDSRF